MKPTTVMLPITTLLILIVTASGQLFFTPTSQDVWATCQPVNIFWNASSPLLSSLPQGALMDVVLDMENVETFPNSSMSYSGGARVIRLSVQNNGSLENIVLDGSWTSGISYRVKFFEEGLGAFLGSSDQFTVQGGIGAYELPTPVAMPVVTSCMANGCPLKTTYTRSTVRSTYPAAQLAGIMKPGSAIHRIAFKVAQVPTYRDITNFEVKIAFRTSGTSAPSYPSTAADYSLNPLNRNLLTQNFWFDMPLNNPVIWDGRTDMHVYFQREDTSIDSASTPGDGAVYMRGNFASSSQTTTSYSVTSGFITQGYGNNWNSVVALAAEAHPAACPVPVAMTVTKPDALDSVTACTSTAIRYSYPTGAQLPTSMFINIGSISEPYRNWWQPSTTVTFPSTSTSITFDPVYVPKKSDIRVILTDAPLWINPNAFVYGQSELFTFVSGYQIAEFPPSGTEFNNCTLIGCPFNTQGVYSQSVTTYDSSWLVSAGMIPNSRINGIAWKLAQVPTTRDISNVEIDISATTSTIPSTSNSGGTSTVFSPTTLRREDINRVIKPDGYVWFDLTTMFTWTSTSRNLHIYWMKLDSSNQSFANGGVVMRGPVVGAGTTTSPHQIMYRFGSSSTTYPNKFRYETGRPLIQIRWLPPVCPGGPIPPGPGNGGDDDDDNGAFLAIFLGSFFGGAFLIFFIMIVCVRAAQQRKRREKDEQRERERQLERERYIQNEKIKQQQMQQPLSPNTNFGTSSGMMVPQQMFNPMMMPQQGGMQGGYIPQQGGYQPMVMMTPMGQQQQVGGNAPPAYGQLYGMQQQQQLPPSYATVYPQQDGKAPEGLNQTSASAPPGYSGSGEGQVNMSSAPGKTFSMANEGSSTTSTQASAPSLAQVAPAPSQQGSGSGQPLPVCPICNDSPQSAVIVPCGHAGCANCLGYLSRSSKPCHICRGPISSVVPIRFG